MTTEGEAQKLFTGFIGVADFFEYFEWPRNAFSDHLFTFMEATDDDGGIDFGDFVKVTN